MHKKHQTFNRDSFEELQGVIRAVSEAASARQLAELTGYSRSVIHVVGKMTKEGKTWSDYKEYLREKQARSDSLKEVRKAQEVQSKIPELKQEDIQDRYLFKLEELSKLLEKQAESIDSIIEKLEKIKAIKWSI